MAEFEVGDKAVYPGYGVAEITGIENREISGAEMKFYVLRVLGKDMTLMVPMMTICCVFWMLPSDGQSDQLQFHQDVSHVK